MVASFWPALTTSPTFTSIEVTLPAVEKFAAPVVEKEDSSMNSGETKVVRHGKPGVRAEYHPGYYGAFVRDPDGNNVEAVHHTF